VSRAGEIGHSSWLKTLTVAARMSFVPIVGRSSAAKTRTGTGFEQQGHHFICRYDEILRY